MKPVVFKDDSVANKPGDVLKKAVRHLKRSDKVMAGVINQVGPIKYRPTKPRFRLLVGSIISQQISTAAARSISKRFDALFDGSVTPAKLAEVSETKLRSAGISPQKMKYLKDLAAKVGDGTVKLRRMSNMDDQAIIDELILIKGIGVWTAQMFLMFGLGRTDVMPHGDLGIQNGIQAAYGLLTRPDRDRCLKIAAPWSPYATIACLYLWRSLDG